MIEEEYKKVIEVGLGLIEEKLMETFGLTTVDALDIMTEYFEVVQSKEEVKEVNEDV